MDLKEINPFVYKMWDEYRHLGDDYYEITGIDMIESIENEIGAKLPEDFIEFSLKYSCFDSSPSLGMAYFFCKFSDRSVIQATSLLTPPGSSILQALRSLRRPHPAHPQVRRRVPEGVVPFNAGTGHSTIMLDVRPATHGQVLFLDKIKVQNFGTPDYDWDNIGWVANSYTDFLRGLGTEKELVAKHNVPVKP
ncbi:SMI1/KNR4 family protein [Fulvimarina sp. MAC3]|uniref:SMI1/KNR4 family protein n=1 Tax=Fulvimarina sp. MAC3 TaxID=3148887 RepID=UPI0031FC0170